MEARASRLTRAVCLVVVAYFLCCLLDYTFFDYDFPTICCKQALGCALMICVLILCAALEWVGYALLGGFILACGVLTYAWHVYGYTPSYGTIAAFSGTSPQEISAFITPGVVAIVAGGCILYALLVVLLRKLIRFRTIRARLLTIPIILGSMYGMRQVPYRYYDLLYAQACDRNGGSGIPFEHPCSKAQRNNA